MKPLLITSGEPAGIGPDLCLSLAEHDLPVVVLGDRLVLEERAKALKLPVDLIDYQENQTDIPKGCLRILPIACPRPVVAGELDSENASYVLEMLNQAALLCKKGEFSALITAPVHKAVINEAGIPFTGHTEFFADFFKVRQVVMMLACKQMKVALVTTHLPLSQVPKAITTPLIIEVITQLNHSLIHDFGILNPKIKVAGLNPHAGESGYLGREEIEVISPALAMLKTKGILVEGPLSADTLYTQGDCDAYVAMYHDQGLPVLKYAGFNRAVNITLGLPIIRTSVDHGTALELAGTGRADRGSLLAAVQVALHMASNRVKHDNN